MTTICTTTYGFPSQGFSNVTLPGPSLRTMCSAAEYICFMTALDEAIRNNPKISRSSERIESIDEPAEEYDFIVVGGGAGGAAVAGRLAEIPDWKILLIEAGDEESAAGQIPGFHSRLGGTEIEWNYQTSNERHACLSTNGSCKWNAAKSLGGSTAHNSMMYLRGNPTDYDNWAALGNDGWGYDEVLKFFKKLEDNANIDEFGRKFHSTGGPLSVGRFPYVSAYGKAFLKAAEQLGFDLVPDLNGKDRTGFTILQGYQKNGVRVSSATAYLRLHRNDKNLDISLNSHVKKIIFENKTAVSCISGKISLATNNSLDHPVMWGNYFNDPIDVEVIIDGIYQALKFLNADALRALDLTLANQPIEACSNHTFLSREYWACDIQQRTVIMAHQVGSCKMGPFSDQMAVVDPQLRVHGIKNLRVADASIMPKVISGTTAAPTMMIGERAADFIKKTWIPSSESPQ